MEKDRIAYWYDRIRRALRRRGIASRTADMVCYAIADQGCTYTEARDAYADYTGAAPEQVQSDLCYAVLKAGFDRMPGELLLEILEEEGIV